MKRTVRLLAFATIYLVWGSTYLGIRLAVAVLPPFLMAGLRFLIAGIGLYGFLRSRGMPAPSQAQWRSQARVGLLLVGANAVVCWAEQSVPSGLSALAVGISPIFMVTIAWAHAGGEAPNRRIWLGIALGLAGLLILFGPGAFAPGTRPPFTRVLALFVSAAGWCAGSVLSKHASPKVEPMLGAGMQMLSGGAAATVAGLALGERIPWRAAATAPSSLIAFLYLVVVGSLVAFPTYIWLLKHEPPARVASYAYVNPVVALIAGWLCLHESIPQNCLAAVPLLVGGIFLVVHETGRAACLQSEKTLPHSACAKNLLPVPAAGNCE